jgi:FG-GAP-like repeat
MLKTACLALLVGLAAAWGLEGNPACSSAKAQDGAIPFEHVVIDSHAPLNQWAIGVGDINGDGQPDAVSSGEGPMEPGATGTKGGVYWYEYPAWTKHVVDARGTFADDMQLVDVDGDGDLDIVVPEDSSRQVRWYENPRPRGNPAADPWKVHVIGGYAPFNFEEAHDVEVADLNGDGKVDIVIANQKWAPPRPGDQPEDVVFFQNNPDSWTPVVVSNTYGEGTCLADLNGDGRVDIVKGGWWLENPRDPLHDPWPQHWFLHGWPDRAGVTVADINQDGRPDVVLSAAESKGRLSWFEAPTDAIYGMWKEHLIQDHVDYVHTFKVADINLDGKPDVVFAEMQDADQKRVGFFLNQGKGEAWKLQVLANTGSHNIRVADVDHDGDIDILGANYDTEHDPLHAPMEMWRNLLRDHRTSQHRNLSTNGGPRSAR